MTDQKIALITGAGRGLGKATALALAAAGYDLVLTHRSEGGADEVVRQVGQLGRKAVAARLDTSHVSEFAPFAASLSTVLAENWGRESFDVLVNNAGNSVAAPFIETTEAQFDSIYAVHVRGVYFLTQKLVPLIADGGSVVLFSTGLTRFVAAGQSAYGSAKGAIDVLTKYLAQELGARGIRVNAIAPGPIATEFGGGMMQTAEFKAAFAPRVALGRVGEPEDIGGAIAALVSDGSRWITAQRIEASGGTLL